MYSYSYNTSTISDAEAGGILAALFGFIAAMWLVCLIIVVISIIAQWKLFTKAGREGWKAIIPFYNMYTLTEICGLNGWMFLISFIPGVGAIAWSIMIAIKLAPAYGKDTAFSIGLIFLPQIFQMILAFGSAQYVLGDNKTANSSASAQAKPAAAPKAKEEDPWVAGK